MAASAPAVAGEPLVGWWRAAPRQLDISKAVGTVPNKWLGKMALRIEVMVVGRRLIL